jgi:hypothetical protein
MGAEAHAVRAVPEDAATTDVTTVVEVPKEGEAVRIPAHAAVATTTGRSTNAAPRARKRFP